MKAKFIKGTTLAGKPVNEGDVLDLSESDYKLFVHRLKDAVPFEEAATPTEAPVDEKKGKKKV